MVYTWRDSDGTTHYTNKAHEIPTRYKAKAKPLYSELADMSVTNAQAALNPPKPDLQPVQAPELQTTNDEQQKTQPAVVAITPKNSVSVPTVKSGRRQRVRSTTSEE